MHSEILMGPLTLLVSRGHRPSLCDSDSMMYIKESHLLIHNSTLWNLAQGQHLKSKGKDCAISYSHTHTHTQSDTNEMSHKQRYGSLISHTHYHSCPKGSTTHFTVLNSLEWKQSLKTILTKCLTSIKVFISSRLGGK